MIKQICFFTTSILHFKAQITHNRRNLAALTLCYIQSFVSLVVESVELSFCALSKNEQRTARRLFCTYIQVTASSIKGARLSNIEAQLERGLDFSRARQVKSLMPIMNFVTALTRRTVT